MSKPPEGLCGHQNDVATCIICHTPPVETNNTFREPLPNTSCCVLCNGENAGIKVCFNACCPCHMAHQSSQSKGDEWEKTFDDLVADQDGRDFVDSSLRISVLKSFISKLLSERQNEIKSDLARIIYGAEKTPDMILGDVARYLETVLAPTHQ